MCAAIRPVHARVGDVELWADPRRLDELHAASTRAADDVCSEHRREPSDSSNCAENGHAGESHGSRPVPWH